MTVTVSPSIVSGTLNAPPSKSSAQRACAAALLTPGTTIIDNFCHSNDEQAALHIISKLGAVVNKVNNQLVISSSDYIFKSAFPEKNLLINCGESGLSMRMFAPVAALFNFEITFTGEGSILTRPMDFFDAHFPSLDVEIHSNSGKLPVTIKGPLHPKPIAINGSMSSHGFATSL